MPKGNWISPKDPWPRVAIFTDTFLPQVNGVAMTLDRITQFLSKAGVPHMIFAPDCGTLKPRPKNLRSFTAVDFLLYPEIRLSVAPHFHISAQVERFRPDVLHILTEGPMGLSGLWYGQANRIPMASSFTTDFPKYLNYYHLGFLEGMVWNYLTWFHNQCLMTLCPSQEMQTTLENRGFLNLRIWGRGVDTTLFSPAKRSDNVHALKGVAREDELRYLYVGRLAPEKDLDILLDAWRQVSLQVPNARLIIAGDGPSRKDLEEKAARICTETSSVKKTTRSSKTGPKIVFIGYVRGEELAQLYASCHVFAFPSTTETFGNVVQEAMASGLPVIVPASGGVKNLVTSGETGLVVSPQNPHEMAETMVRLAQDSSLRNRLGENARKYACGRSWDTLLASLLSIYRTLAERQYQEKAS